MKHYLITWIVVVSSIVTGCTSYPRYLNFSFDAGGRGLNSRASELTPQVTATYIVFISDRNGSQDVYLFDAQQRQLMPLPGLNTLDEIASHPSISEDGRYLVFASSRQGKSNIYVYDRQTEQKRNLTANLQAEVRNPIINADGNQIAFEIAEDGQWDIMIYDLSGNPLKLP
ncbi:TolB family protein [Crocosphaera sp.]|uniref:TolB family protein n=1 Tax=Crocosphaera sp. TaxID=2729996 RepID=UPI003F25C52D